MSWVIWITGLPGSGKTTMARGLVEALGARGVHAILLELGEMRRALLPRSSRSPAEDEVVHRALAYTAKLLSEGGVPVVVDATAPRRSWRETARAMIQRYAEVQLMCPPEVCGARERAVRWRLYAASTAAAADVGESEPDIVLEYEYSVTPELIVYTDVEHPVTVVRQLVVLAKRLEQDVSTRPEPAERRPT